MGKKTQKYLDSTEEEIEEYLKKLKILVSRDKFKISDKNREKNISFINEYRLNRKKQKDMLLSLEVKDFCYAVDDYNSDDKLYIFCKEYELDNWGSYEIVPVYIKINIISKGAGDFCIIVSFHKPEKDIKFLFK